MSTHNEAVPVTTQSRLEKHRLRRAFDRAASTYDGAAVLPREVCDRMLERLALVKVLPRLMVDVGCGTGYAASHLLARFPGAHLIELDLSAAMLRQVRNRRVSTWRRLLMLRPRRTQVCADNECIPIAASSVDLVWSNLVLHWTESLENALTEAYRVLQPGGLLMFSMLGPDTLRELRGAFAATDAVAHVNSFVDMHDIGDVLVRIGYADPVMDMEYFTLTYPDVRGLMLDIKLQGSSNANEARTRSLTGKRLLDRVVENYERFRQADGRLPATFEVVYGHAWRPLRKVGLGGRPVIEIKPRNSLKSGEIR